MNHLIRYGFIFLAITAFIFNCHQDQLFAEVNSKDKQNIDPFVVFTPPKCGTSLMIATFSLMLDRECIALGYLNDSAEEAFKLIENAMQSNKFVVTHQVTPALLNILVSKGYKIVSILRDPRDQLISLLDYIKEGLPWPKPIHENQDFNACIAELITDRDFPSYHCIEYVFKPLASVLQENYCYVTRFEKLVGSKGYGDDELQLQEIYKLANFINFDLTLEKAQMVCDQLFGNNKSSTFRHGQIGRWKQYFSLYHKELYKKRYGLTLIELGYENDLNW